MLKFKKLNKNAIDIKKYLDSSKISFCDISIGAKYLWRNDFKIDYAIIDETLILKESSKDYLNAFYYPMGKNIDNALKEIETYAKENYGELTFCCIDNVTCAELVSRYDSASVYNDRNWSDYIYNYQDFIGFRGKKFSGQRNHINKFKKTYPDYIFTKLSKEHLPAVKLFLKNYERENEFSMWTEIEENKNIYDYVENFERLCQTGGVLMRDNKVIGLSVGEVVGDTLIVHVEKALKSYSGIYPTLASSFAGLFIDNPPKYINREEDCGDMGLRISKLQYHPIEVKEKNFVKVKTLFDKISAPVFIKTDRLTITDITPNDKGAYYKLYIDKELNKYWGYDYKKDLIGEETPDYFYSFQKQLKQKKEEYTFAVRLEGKYIGELVLHNFDFFGGVEIGYRFFKSHQGKGYASESAKALIDYAVNYLCAKKLKTRCFKKNTPSYNLINRLGFTLSSQDTQKFYFTLP